MLPCAVPYAYQAARTDLVSGKRQNSVARLAQDTVLHYYAGHWHR